MLAILTVLLVVGLSLVVTRIATVALILTGMSREAARFQARSALTGAGFTTTESESVVSHPLRRRIVMTLMLVGSAGIVTVVASVALSFANAGGAADASRRIALLVAGLVVLLWLASSRRFDRVLQPVIRRALKRFTDLEVRDHAAMLNIHGEYAVSELRVAEHSWLAGRRLDELRLADEGVLVLGIERGATTYVGAPTGSMQLRAHDTLVVYGQQPRIQDLDGRPSGARGERAHQHAAQEERARRRREQVTR